MKKIIDYFKCCRILQLAVALIIIIPLLLYAADLRPAGQIFDFSAPPAKDTSLIPPEDWGDVIGNPSDGHGANTLAGFLNEIREHFHKETKVYPTLADCISITSGAGDWQLGSFTQIVPENTITEEFDIHQIFIENFNQTGKTYELVLYQGNSDIEVGRMRFRIIDGTPVGRTISAGGQFQTPLILENRRVRAKLAIEDGGSKTACISIRYHTY